MGSLLGAALFYFQKGPPFPLIAATPVSKMLLVMFVGCILLPLPISMDIRGWQEMHPLNGPAWSLFFEYIANILYALACVSSQRKPSACSSSWRQFFSFISPSLGVAETSSVAGV